MKIKHIYITKEGEPMAIPINDDGTWSEGYLPFENKTLVWAILISKTSIVHEKNPIDPEAIKKPDTLIPVDLEVEVVGQYKGDEKYGGGWVTQGHMGVHNWLKNKFPHFEYRKALRIKL